MDLLSVYIVKLWYVMTLHTASMYLPNFLISAISYQLWSIYGIWARDAPNAPTLVVLMHKLHEHQLCMARMAYRAHNASSNHYLQTLVHYMEHLARQLWIKLALSIFIWPIDLVHTEWQPKRENDSSDFASEFWMSHHWDTLLIVPSWLIGSCVMSMRKWSCTLGCRTVRNTPAHRRQIIILRKLNERQVKISQVTCNSWTTVLHGEGFKGPSQQLKSITFRILIYILFIGEASFTHI